MEESTLTNLYRIYYNVMTTTEIISKNELIEYCGTKQQFDSYLKEFEKSKLLASDYIIKCEITQVDQLISDEANELMSDCLNLSVIQKMSRIASGIEFKLDMSKAIFMIKNGYLMVKEGKRGEWLPSNITFNVLLHCNIYINGKKF